MKKVPERFLWAVDMMNINQKENILEIGCGAGLLAEQIAEHLNGGCLTAIDKSAPMIEKAIKRNSRILESKKISFENCRLTDFSNKDVFYDKVVAFNVNIFFKISIKDVDVLKKVMKPESEVFVFYQAPYEIDLDAAKPIVDNLILNDFEIIRSEVKKLQPTSAVCVVAKKKAR